MNTTLSLRTIKDAAADLGVSADILRRLEAAGQIPAPTRHPVNGYRIYSHYDIRSTRAALV
ncbi:MAG TPA: MerR family DNA-binding transcriptional regulator, partial [Chloroflexota bacterium]|nr:MerR family DNA-binding transcriptional regulator [Chloroflexota bacterium]